MTVIATASTPSTAGRRYARCRTSDATGRRYHHGASRFSQPGRRYYDCCQPATITPARRARVHLDLSGERASDWDAESLTELTSGLYTSEVSAWASRELSRRAGFRGTGLSRSTLLNMWREAVELQYLAAESARNGQLLNPAGRAARVSARSIFTGPARRAALYASDELLWYWADNPRLTFDSWLGDSDAAKSAAIGF